MSETEYGRGDVIRVRGLFGSGPVFRAYVEAHEADVKNGRPGGYGRAVDGYARDGGVWWYDTQVVGVVGHGGDEWTRGRKRVLRAAGDPDDVLTLSAPRTSKRGRPGGSAGGA